MKKNRVVITGIGVVAPNGIGKNNFLSALKEGKSGVKEITLFDASDLPTNIAGEVSNFNAQDFLPTKIVRKRGRASHFAMVATKLAMEDANINLDPEKVHRTGIAIGTTFPAMDQFQEHIQKLYSNGRYATQDIYKLYEAASPTVTSMDISEVCGFIGHRITISNACSSGASALIHAYRHISEGKFDVYLAGGIDACLTYFTYAAFIAAGVQVVSSLPPEKISRPFDKNRTGAVCSEGAALLMLEELDFALNRGASIYGEIIGVGEAVQISNDHPTTIRKGLAQSMNLALADANLSPSEIDYICSHGCSLVHSDKMETLAIKDVFGKYAYRLPISSIKSMIGNPMAAAAPMQVIAALMAIKESIICPTINLEFPDPACDLDYVPNKARKNIVDFALVDSHGLDNIDVSIILSKNNI